MSFFRKLFGGGSFEELRADADRQFEERDFGAAKITYEKALAKAKGAPADAATHVERRVGESRDALARLRIEEADRLVREDEPGLARTELVSAQEIAASRSLQDEIMRRIERLDDGLQRADARDRADDVVDASDDEIYEALAGTWVEDQTEEYDSLGERFRRAYLALHARDVDTALPLLESIVEGARDPRYVWYELGRARVLAAALRRAEAAKAAAATEKTTAGAEGDAAAEALAKPVDGGPGESEGAAARAAAAPTDDPTDALFRSGEEALRKFLSRIGPDEGGLTRLATHVELAGLASLLRNDDAAAEKELRAATEALPDETRAWLVLGQWLRQKKRYDEAYDVLRDGIRVMSETVPDIGLELELAFLERDRGNDADAIRLLEPILERVSRGELDYRPDIAVPLAEAYEKTGQLRRASDVWRHLAHGSDVQNHERYHREAARLLVRLGDEDEAHRMLVRALEIAKTDESRAELEASLEKLGGPRRS